MRGSTSVGYDQFETSPEAIEQELRPAICERRLTDRLKTNYSIDTMWLIIRLLYLFTVTWLWTIITDGFSVSITYLSTLLHTIIRLNAFQIVTPEE